MRVVIGTCAKEREAGGSCRGRQWISAQHVQIYCWWRMPVWGDVSASSTRRAFTSTQLTVR